MTEDEIIEMAQECKLIGMRPHLDGIYSEALVVFAKLVASKEREACALICELVYKRMCPEAQENEVGIEAEIIRARGEQA